MHRPSFALAWAAAMRIYTPSDPDEKVASYIGGRVAINIRSTDPSMRWTNTCVVRISWILGHCGLLIPTTAHQTVSGADGRQYFFRINDIKRFLQQRWGRPDQQFHHIARGRQADMARGVVIFETSGWHDARGHISLLLHGQCYDRCYFGGNPLLNYRLDQASFWSLPP